MIDVDRPCSAAMIAKTAHDLRGRIKSHRLRIQKRAIERVRKVTLEPAGDINAKLATHQAAGGERACISESKQKLKL